MDKKKKIIIITAAAIVVVLAIAAAIIAARPKNTAAPTEADGQVQQKTEVPAKDDGASDGDASSGEEKVYTPTFMYFISSADADFDKTNEVIERLKSEYDGKVKFDIRNVDNDPAQLENFPVEGKTPALIMLDTKNEISGFLFQTGNYDELKAAIDAAMK